MEVCRTYCTGKVVVLEQLVKLADHPFSLRPACRLHYTSHIPLVMGCLGIFVNFVSRQQPGSLFVAGVCTAYQCRVEAGWNQRLLSSNRTVDIAAHWVMSPIPGLLQYMHMAHVNFWRLWYRWSDIFQAIPALVGTSLEIRSAFRFTIRYPATFPRPSKVLTVSHPVNAWKSGNDLHTCSNAHNDSSDVDVLDSRLWTTFNEYWRGNKALERPKEVPTHQCLLILWWPKQTLGCM